MTHFAPGASGGRFGARELIPQDTVFQRIGAISLKHDSGAAGNADCLAFMNGDNARFRLDCEAGILPTAGWRKS